jgi:Alpha-glucosidases, family 31 of glycosyl hydrolases
MKFTDGYWCNKEGLTVLNPLEIDEIRKDSGSFTVYAPCRPQNNRFDTVDTAQLTINVSSPMPEVLCVKIWHFKGVVKKGPAFEINKSLDVKVEIAENDDEISLASGKLSAKVSKKGGWGIDYFYDGKRITGSGRKYLAHITKEDGSTYMKEQLSLSTGECVYGLGERFTSFVKNGQVVDMWNEDGGTCSEIAYKNIPFYLTNKGYGVLVADPGKVSFEVASEVVTRTQFSVPGEYLEYYIIGGPAPKDVLRRYTELTGRPSLPPAWSFGLWLTTSFTTSYDENTVNSFVDGMRDRNIPLNVFHFDCFWMKEYQLCDFEWDKDQFPDPKAQLKRLKDKGLKICVWINPYISQKSYMFDEGMENGYLVKKPDGSVWQWDRWQAGMGLVDFTNPAAAKWFQEKLRRLVNIGVDCFKTDFGERIPTDVVYFDGSDPFKMHNYYTYLYNKAVYSMLEEEKGKNKALLFARSATVGNQKFPVHWGGDCSATYESMAESLRGGLSLCLSGFGFWSHDISGFEKTATPDLYKRWCAFGLLSTHSRLHGNESYRVPWLFGDEAVDVLRFFTNLKCTLMPYLFSEACKTVQDGVPVMRAMFLEFTDDPSCDYLDRQYMLGGSLLVAPIFSEDGNVCYYLPEGSWTNFITGEKVEGGSWKHENHGFMSLPLMVRPNSVIAVGNNKEKTEYDYVNDVTLHVFELQDGNVETLLYDLEGNLETTFCFEQKGKMLDISCIGKGKPWKVLLRGISAVGSVENGDLESTELGTLVIPKSNVESIRIKLI